MKDKNWTISIPADEEGYIPLRCPHCESEFKLLARDLEQYDGSDLHCAACGLSDERSQFLLVPDVKNHISAQVQNLAADLLNNFVSDLERSTRGSKFVKVTATPAPKKTVPELYAVTDLATAEVPCCDTTVKLSADQAASLFYCPFCGQTQR